MQSTIDIAANEVRFCEACLRDGNEFEILNFSGELQERLVHLIRGVHLTLQKEAEAQMAVGSLDFPLIPC